MKSNKAIKVLTITLIILIILLVSCVSFFGILKHNLNKWDNILPEYSFSKELSSARIFSFNVDESTKEVEKDTETEETNDTEETTEENVDDSVDVNETVTNDGETEETENSEETGETENSEEAEEPTTEEVPVNDQSVLNSENYKKVKKIIEKRLESFGIADYNLRVNEENGKIEVEVPYEDGTDKVIDLVTKTGKIEIVDSDTNEVLMDNSHIKSATAYYTGSNSETAGDENSLDIGIQFEFTKDGLSKFKEISKNYVETIDESGESKIKSITIKIDDEEKYKTYFSLDGNYTNLPIPLYQGVSEDETINEDYRECILIQDNINSGKLPIVYTLDSGIYIEGNSNNNVMKISIIVLIVTIAIISICLILKNKKIGIMSLILEIGYIALLLIMIRYASVTISMTGLIAILASCILNYYFIILMNKNKNKYLPALGRFILSILPLIIIMIVFNFSNTVQLKSIGMILFWGLFILIFYNAILSNILLNCCDKENEKGAEK